MTEKQIKSIKDWGPAFPRDSVYDGGMSIRQWYAGMALQGLLACPDTTGNIEEVVKDAFKCADAMIKASYE